MVVWALILLPVVVGGLYAAYIYLNAYGLTTTKSRLNSTMRDETQQRRTQ